MSPAFFNVPIVIAFGFDMEEVRRTGGSGGGLPDLLAGLLGAISELVSALVGVTGSSKPVVARLPLSDFKGTVAVYLDSYGSSG